MGSELTTIVNQKRFCFPEGNLEFCAEKVAPRGLWAFVQSESPCYKLLGGLGLGGPASVCCGSLWTEGSRAVRLW